MPNGAEGPPTSRRNLAYKVWGAGLAPALEIAPYDIQTVAKSVLLSFIRRCK